jgi:hypothetical protein
LNGGIWHIQIGIPPKPPTQPSALIPPSAPPKPQPWVTTQDRNMAELVGGHSLVAYSPQELLQMAWRGENTDAFLNRWIKIDFDINATPVPMTIQNKQYLTLEFGIFRFGFFAVGSIVTYFDEKKWGDQLLALHKDDHLKAFCQFEGIDSVTISANSQRYTLKAFNCEIYSY